MHVCTLKIQTATEMNFLVLNQPPFFFQSLEKVHSLNNHKLLHAVSWFTGEYYEESSQTYHHPVHWIKTRG